MSVYTFVNLADSNLTFHPSWCNTVDSIPIHDLQLPLNTHGQDIPTSLVYNLPPPRPQQTLRFSSGLSWEFILAMGLESMRCSVGRF